MYINCLAGSQAVMKKLPSPPINDEPVLKVWEFEQNLLWH